MIARLKGVAALTALAISGLALPATAAIVVGSTPVASPIAATGFETLPSLLGPNVDYVDGGIDVKYVTIAINDDFIIPDFTAELNYVHGVQSWGMVDNHGYTEVTLAGGGTFNAFSGFFGSEFDLPGRYLVAEFRLNGALVEAVSTLGLVQTGKTYSFSNFTADEVRLRASACDAFVCTGQVATDDLLGADDLALGRSSGAPEPASWMLAIVGFGLAGVSLRRRQVYAC